MFNEAPIARCLRLAFIGGLVGATLASQVATAQTVQQGERVEITGSNIRRVQSETASPVQTVSREDIERSGKTSVAELLQTLALDNAGSVPKTFYNGFSSGGAAISLRGLGAGATLVLVNGRRVAPFALADDGTKTYTDLNTIPLEAVERIEILKDGGSAVYGSDAIAGVVNIILKKEFNGLQARVSVGQSLQYGDGRDTQFSVMGGFGNLDTDGYNFFGDLEYHKTNSIDLSNRTDRGRVGRTDLRTDGFTSSDTTAGGAGAGGTGAILAGRASTGSSIIGNVRNPTTLLYYSRDDQRAATGFTRTFPGAACSNFTSYPQGDPNGSCLIDATNKYVQVQPSSEDYNFYGRGSFKLGDNFTGYFEGNYYQDTTRTHGTPSGVSGSWASPTAAVTSNGILGANHPDNPYFGSAARLRYLATDVGGRNSANDSTFSRFLVGVRGSAFGWDIDTAATYSRDRIKEVRTGFLQFDVLTALLNPTAANVAIASANSAAYRALPAGSVYRIGENAGLNSAALYQALSPAISATGQSQTALADFKASRELFNLPGGALGVAIGAEFRHEQNSLTPVSGTERANIVGLGYSAYSLSRNISAIYAEAVAPVVKMVEISAAARYDHYSDAGNSFTPKAGIKFTPIEQFAIRGTFSKGFRAPNAPESGGGTAAFATSPDPVRCALGVTSVCSATSVAFISSGNPNLQPEHSKVFTGGIVLDPTKTTSIALDYFNIVRKNEIIAGSGSNSDAVLAGRVTRDPTNTQAGIAGDPGLLVAILAPYVNSSRTRVRGLDLDARQDVPLASYGKLSFGVKWTHLFSYQVVDNEGNVSEYAGTHGNCNTTNCIGTPADRVNADLTYNFGNFTISTLVNFRAGIKNTEIKDDPNGCETTLLSGADNPGNCRIGSFTTFDLTARWRPTRNWEVFGTVQNLFDRVPPYDPTTYGAVNYNPLDFSGAIGRFFSVGAR